MPDNGQVRGQHRQHHRHRQHAAVDRRLLARTLAGNSIADAGWRAEVEAASEEAIRQAEESGAAGNAVTPAVLAGMVQLTSGRVIAANLALAEHNAQVATAIAAALLP